jgi:ComF family protein
MFSIALPLAELMAQRYPQWSAQVDLILPVPLHPERVRERGYNQAALLVRHLCRLLDVAYDEDKEGALWRTRHTRPQVGLDRAQRHQNVEGAFAADNTYVHGKNVLLIDDVCTSGATMAAAAGALISEGASTVRGYCFARPVSS